jgi:hypothetical protein
MSNLRNENSLEVRLANLRKQKEEKMAKWEEEWKEKDRLKEEEKKRKEKIGEKLLKIAKEKFSPFLKVISEHFFGKILVPDQGIQPTESSAYVTIGFYWGQEEYWSSGPSDNDYIVRKGSQISFTLYDDLSAGLYVGDDQCKMKFSLNDKDWEVKIEDKLFMIIEKEEYRYG